MLSYTGSEGPITSSTKIKESALPYTGSEGPITSSTKIKESALLYTKSGGPIISPIRVRESTTSSIRIKELALLYTRSGGPTITLIKIKRLEIYSRVRRRTASVSIKVEESIIYPIKDEPKSKLSKVVEIRSETASKNLFISLDIATTAATTTISKSRLLVVVV